MGLLTLQPIELLSTTTISPPEPECCRTEGPVLESCTLFQIPEDSRNINALIVSRFISDGVILVLWSGSPSTSSAWKPVTATTPAFGFGLKGQCGCTTLIFYSPNG